VSGFFCLEFLWRNEPPLLFASNRFMLQNNSIV